MNNKRSAEPAPDPLASVDLLAPRLRRELRTKVGSLKAFSSGFVGIDLFPYQLEAGEAIARSVLRRDGETFVLIFARQSGKDELLKEASMKGKIYAVSQRSALIFRDGALSVVGDVFLFENGEKKPVNRAV